MRSTYRYVLGALLALASYAPVHAQAPGPFGSLYCNDVPFVGTLSPGSNVSLVPAQTNVRIGICGITIAPEATAGTSKNQLSISEGTPGTSTTCPVMTGPVLVNVYLDNAIWNFGPGTNPFGASFASEPDPSSPLCYSLGGATSYSYSIWYILL